MPFNAHASLPQSHLIEPLEVFLLRSTFEVHLCWLLSLQFNPHLLLPWSTPFCTSWPQIYCCFDLVLVYIYVHSFRFCFHSPPFGGWCLHQPYVDVLDLFLCTFLLPISWPCFHLNFSTIFGKWSKWAGFTYRDSFEWHPSHLTKYCLLICLVYLAARMHFTSPTNLCSIRSNPRW